jgi:hypothetical protein
MIFSSILKKCYKQSVTKNMLSVVELPIGSTTAPPLAFSVCMAYISSSSCTLFANLTTTIVLLPEGRCSFIYKAERKLLKTVMP